MTFAKRSSGDMANVINLPVVANATLQERSERDSRITIRRLRRSLFRTQQAAADWAGVACSTIARWESGESTIPLWVFLAFEGEAVARRMKVAA
jgi:DNA-binding transcriptional regulator YiaG